MLTKVKKIVKKTIYETMAMLNHDMNNVESKVEELILFGENGIFDSITLVSFIVDVEENLQQECNIDILLANEKAFSQKKSPFKDYNSLISYISFLLEKN